MKALTAVLNVMGGILKTLRLAIPKIGVGWMFAVLTSNFNTVAINDLQVAAVVVTTMIGLHHFLSPFQVIWGRIADRHPIFGLRRTPYYFIGTAIASTVLVLLPSVALGLSAGNPLAYIAGFALLILFGIGVAAAGDCHHSLIAEVTSERTRGGVIAVVWTFTIMSGIMAAVVMRQIMPKYTPEAMQTLYGLTPFIVLGSGALGLLGMERRRSTSELAVLLERAAQVAPQRNPLRAAASVLRTNVPARGFFAFVFLSVFAIFLQDSILEPFGREVFGMTLKQTAAFQQVWGGGVLLGMIVIGLASALFPISKKLLASLGCVGTALGLGVLAMTAFTQQQGMLNVALMIMGLSTGVFNIGALSMMMDMTVEGATGLYMGLWGMAQAFGNGFSSIVAGALHTTLIAQLQLPHGLSYTLIFGAEALVMVAAVVVLQSISVATFRGLTSRDLTRAMEAGAAA